MTSQDRQRLKVLIVLLVVLGLTVVFGYRINRPPTASAVRSPEAKAQASGSAETAARLRLDLVQKPSAEDEIGRNNLFQYRMGRPATDTPRPGAGAGSGPIVKEPVPNQPPASASPPGPPSPPPIPLKYQGFAVVSPGSNQLTAFLADDADHYNVVEGEVLMGRFRIVRIMETTVEVEDLVFNRRQSLPLIKQQ